MDLITFSKLIAILFTSDNKYNDKYEVTFNLCDEKGASTYTVRDIKSFEDILEYDNVSLDDTYYVQILEMKTISD